MTGPSEKVGRTGMEIAATLGPTRGEATVRDLRHYAARIKDSDDRELVQHAADMLEIAFRTAATLREASALPSATQRIQVDPEVMEWAEEVTEAASTTGEMIMAAELLRLNAALRSVDGAAKREGQDG